MTASPALPPPRRPVRLRQRGPPAAPHFSGLGPKGSQAPSRHRSRPTPAVLGVVLFCPRPRGARGGVVRSIPSLPGVRPAVDR